MTAGDLEKFNDMFKSGVELDPELAVYKEESPRLGTVVRHPLVFSVPHSDMMNHMLNESFRHKKQAVADAVKACDWSKIIWLHERPYRIYSFIGIASDMSDKEYWHILGKMWTDSENIWQNFDQWVDLLTDKNRDLTKRHSMMSAEEKKVWNGFSFPLTVYRGCTDKNKEGLSWTLDRSKAEWFAKRFTRPEEEMYLLEGVIDNYRGVIAYFAGRGEQEIVSANVRITSDTKLGRVQRDSQG